MGTVQYRVVVRNNTTDFWSACLFQTDPALSGFPAQSLAWMVGEAGPSTELTFAWMTDYSFVWGETGQLKPGMIFDPSQVLPADLSGANAITLSGRGTGASRSYAFVNQHAGPAPGSLSISTDSGVVPNQASVGIGVSGAGTFALQAHPDTDIVFTPHPSYWIGFGHYTQGQVIDDPAAAANVATVDFPPGVYSMYVTLNQDGTWSIGPEPA